MTKILIIFMIKTLIILLNATYIIIVGINYYKFKKTIEENDNKKIEKVEKELLSPLIKMSTLGIITLITNICAYLIININ